MKNILVIILPFLLVSCATFTKTNSFGNEVKLNKTSMVSLDGNFAINPTTEFTKYNNSTIYFAEKKDLNRASLFNFFRKGFSKISDSNAAQYYVNFSFKDKKKLIVSNFYKGIKTDSVQLSYILKNNGFLYLKNNNFKINGIPFLLGGFEVDRLRITLSNENNLIIQKSHYFYGALLLIFGDDRKINNSAIYRRFNIEKRKRDN